MKSKSLLIKTKDGRSFLTQQKHLKSVQEFCRSLGAEIYLVYPNPKEKLLGLKRLTAAFCNPEFKLSPEYKQIKKIFPESKKDRTEILQKAKEIQSYIIATMLEGKPVSLKDLKERYDGQNLTDACLCNHLTAARRKLAKDGHKVQKLGAGKYAISS